MAKAEKDPSKSEPKKDPSTSEQIRRAKPSFSKTALPYILSAVIASAVMAWYFFVFVPAKLDYFVGLKFRTLAVASGHVGTKVQNMAKALHSVPGLSSTECPSPTDARQSLAADYAALVLPELQLGEKGARTAGLRLFKCEIAGTVAWPDVAAQAAAVSRRDFDDLILANEDGDVVWQRELSTPRIGNLSELLGATSEPTSWWSLNWRERATVHVQQDKKHLRSTAVLKTLNLGGRSSLLLVQAVTVPAQGILPAGKPGAATYTLYVGGIASREALQRQAMRVPAAWVVFFALPVMLLFLAIPFFKLRTLMPRERYRYADLVAMIVATIAAAGLGAIIPFMRAPTSAGDPTLDKFHEKIERHLAEETGTILDLAERILYHPESIGSLQQCAVSGSLIRNAQGVESTDKHQCGLWQALGVDKASFELDVVLWFNEQGDQIAKWTTKAQITGPASHRPFDHFRDVMAGRLWTLKSATAKSRLLFTIDPLRAPTTSELGVVFAMPVPTDGNEKRTFFALNARPQSLIDPVVPPGFGFAILAPTGRVLFHSDESLSLEENFFEEVGEPQQVRERARSARLSRWMGDYHGRPHRFRMQPVQTLINSPWLIVTFQELEPELAEEVLQQSGTLRLGSLNLALLIALVLIVTGRSIYKHRRMRDLLQSVLVAKPAGTWLMWVLVMMAILEAIVVGMSFLHDARLNLDWMYGVFVAIPATAFLLTLLARRWQKDAPDGSQLSSHNKRFVSWELALLVLLIAVGPAIAFTRIVQITHNVKAAERWLENVNARWTAREQRVEERVNDPNYTPDRHWDTDTPDTRTLLRKGFATRKGQLDPDAPFAYLSILDGRVVPTQMSTPPDTSPAKGQSLVRYLLEWNILSSGDEPSSALLTQSPTHHQVSLRGANGQLALSSIDVSGPSRNVSWPGLFLGVFILAAAIVGVYWARGRILWPAGGRVLTWPSRTQSYAPVPYAGHAGLLVIGAPKTGKDVLVEDKVSVIHRIRLLGKELTDDDVKKHLQRVEDAICTNKVPAKQRVWILVSNLEAQLVNEECRRRLLKLLDKLLIGDPDHPRVVVVTTCVDPIAHFQELFSEERDGIYMDDAPEVSLSQAALLLSRFQRRYVPLAETTAAECRHAWDSWWRYNPAKWPAAMDVELHGLPLALVKDELATTLAGHRDVPFAKLVRELRRRTNAYYELLWTSCTRKEKLVLIQLAQEGFVTAQSWDVVAPLVAKGLIVERPVPTIFNHTFREFLVDIERSGIVQDWERMEGNGLWQVSGRLIGASLLAGGLFYLLTQDFSVQSLLPVVSGTGMFGAPLFRTIVAKVTGKSLDATV
jgi:hypothetical protein